jgi:hypothetical protein
MPVPIVTDPDDFKPTPAQPGPANSIPDPYTFNRSN